MTLLVDKVDATNDNIEGVYFFRSLTSILQTHFPEMLQRIMIFPTNWLLFTVWKVVKPFLDPQVQEKVSLLGPKEYKAALLDKIPASCLPERYGGTSVDPTDEPMSPGYAGSIHDSAVSIHSVQVPGRWGKGVGLHIPNPAKALHRVGKNIYAHGQGLMHGSASHDGVETTPQAAETLEGGETVAEIDA
ncbi:CRAL-TRIO domain-containing protein [Blyttiomyces helicus]|uniref:CRAL-TRIO domain-containing protein n=1 Tax=Blyttiomyces helicus TaxID=388810 RepID=A0A4P9WF28_9FUNG|nr:CRAL-TRIO domain-containing protein [Blyttiomyces helicus]|eukprot:RKO91224.1 CRAL-TRIO domain-containing protein [Blyttiomyces helicus]